MTLFYVHSCSFYFDMNLFLQQYIRVQYLTSLFMCRLLLELTLVENLVGKSTHSLGPCCLEHLGCCFYLLFFHTYRLFVSWCFYFVLYSCQEATVRKTNKGNSRRRVGERKQKGRKKGQVGTVNSLQIQFICCEKFLRNNQMQCLRVQTMVTLALIFRLFVNYADFFNEFMGLIGLESQHYSKTKVVDPIFIFQRY